MDPVLDARQDPARLDRVRDLPAQLESFVQPVLGSGERRVDVARRHAEPGVDVVGQLRVQWLRRERGVDARDRGQRIELESDERDRVLREVRVRRDDRGDRLPEPADAVAGEDRHRRLRTSRSMSSQPRGEVFARGLHHRIHRPSRSSAV